MGIAKSVAKADTPSTLNRLYSSRREMGLALAVRFFSQKRLVLAGPSQVDVQFDITFQVYHKVKFKGKMMRIDRRQAIVTLDSVPKGVNVTAVLCTVLQNCSVTFC